MFASKTLGAFREHLQGSGETETLCVFFPAVNQGKTSAGFICPGLLAKVSRGRPVWTVSLQKQSTQIVFYLFVSQACFFFPGVRADM